MRLVFVFFAIIFSLTSLAQSDSLKYRDVRFLLSYTNPKFYSSADSAQQVANFRKYYSLYNLLYAEAVSKVPDLSTQKVLDSLSAYISKRYLAEKLLQEKIENVEVTEKEAMEYYRQNSGKFYEHAVYSFFQIFIINESSETVKKAKARVEQILMNPEADFRGEKNEEYKITFQEKFIANKTSPLVTELEKLSVKKISPPLQIEGYSYKVILLVSEKKEETMKPFNSVSAECYAGAKELKTQNLLTELYRVATREYPFDNYLIK